MNDKRIFDIKFETVLCVKAGTLKLKSSRPLNNVIRPDEDIVYEDFYFDKRFEVGEVFPVVAKNNGVQIVFSSGGKNGDTWHCYGHDFGSGFEDPKGGVIKIVSINGYSNDADEDDDSQPIFQHISLEEAMETKDANRNN